MREVPAFRCVHASPDVKFSAICRNLMGIPVWSERLTRSNLTATAAYYDRLTDRLCTEARGEYRLPVHSVAIDPTILAAVWDLSVACRLALLYSAAGAGAWNSRRSLHMIDRSINHRCYHVMLSKLSSRRRRPPSLRYWLLQYLSCLLQSPAYAPWQLLLLCWVTRRKIIAWRLGRCSLQTFGRITHSVDHQAPYLVVVSWKHFCLHSIEDDTLAH